MKYWFFDGNDVVGPFEPKELVARPGFAATSLVCPENYSEDEDSWKMAASFADFHFDAKEILSLKPPEPEPNSGVFDEEMDTLLKERTPLGSVEETSLESPSLEIPQKPSKPGPIEDYFNNIRGEDLGDILGIPDPNENSDMNLARALQNQFEKTTPPTDKKITPIENDPFDEFTSDKSAENTNRTISEPAASSSSVKAGKSLPSVTKNRKEEGPSSIPISKETKEKLELNIPQQIEASENGEEAPSAKKKESIQKETPSISSVQLPVLDQPETQLPILPEGEKAGSSLERPEEANTSSANIKKKKNPTIADHNLSMGNMLPEELVPSANAISASSSSQTDLVPEKKDPREDTVRDIMAGSLKVIPDPEVKEPIKNITVEPQINQIRPRLKQTPEIQEFLNRTQNARIEREKSRKKAMAALSVLTALLAVGGAVYLNQTLHPQQKTSAETVFSEGLAAELTTPVSAGDSSTVTQEENLIPSLDVSVPPPPENIKEASLSTKALLAVQNYQLPGNKGTIGAYLERLYRPQMNQGYTGIWSVEPLHKNIYIVKYRLTKTRLEPIVYVFQADAVQGKLTGALNNITLDLVGKIQ